MLLLADIDAFFASVEQLTKPALRGKPVIVGTGVIASCSYEARRFGLRAGMSLREALRRCPRAIVLDGDEKVYRCFSERIFAICREIAPSVEAYLDEAYLDLAGTERLYESPDAAARLLRERVRREVGLAVTVGIARNRLFAKIATKRAKPDGCLGIREEDEAALLEGLPVDDLPGVGPVYASRLHELNVLTAGAMRALPEVALAALFGENGRALYRRCRGEDTRPVAPREVPRSISRETTFHRPAGEASEIEGMLHYLVERGARTARSLELGVGTVEVSVAYDDGLARAGCESFPEPTPLDGEIFDAAARTLARIHDRRVLLRRVGIVLSRFVPCRSGALQLGLFDERSRVRSMRLQRAVDRVRDLFGHASLVCGRSIHLMERLDQDHHGFVLRTPSLTK